MLDQAQNISDTPPSAFLSAFLSVALPNFLTLTVVNIAGLNVAIQIFAGVITIAYTLWRWRKDIKKGDRQ